MTRTTATVVWLLFQLLGQTSGYEPASRWGQATVVVNDALFVFGGKVDDFNAFSYSSAPNTNDVLYLPLSSAFSASSPPWELVSGTSNVSTAQGPALAWATLSAFSSDSVLAFGGLPDANSDIVLVGESDSAVILDVHNRLGPFWKLNERADFTGQPNRRIRHSTVTLPLGLVLIFGGERADGSRTCLDDSWAFDPNTLSFTRLPTTNAPPTLCGQVSIPLPDGRVLVFGGYNSSNDTLLSFTVIYVLDTAVSPWTWSRLEVSTNTFPSSRRAFAAVLIGPDKILIHGGSDESLQNTYDDGWILDLSTSPAIWTRIEALTALGPRKDHFAVASGSNVIFGFGYSRSSPAPPAIEVYNVDQGTWVPEYNPPPRPATTLPVPSQTSSSTSGTAEPTSVRPGVTPAPPGSGPKDEKNPDEDEDEKKRVTSIAVGTTVAFLALVVVVAGGFYYRRHRNRRFWDERRGFVPVGASTGGDDDSLHAQYIARAARVDEEKGSEHIHKFQAIAGLIRGSTNGKTTRDTRERRNMLEDEDTHDFGTWYETRRREGSSGSAWSLMTFFGRRSREPSLGGHSTSSTPWREKMDPFADSNAPGFDEESGGGAAGRPRNRREASARSGLSYTSYADPFQDPITEERRQPSDTSFEGDAGVRLVNARSQPPMAQLRTTLPLEHIGHQLSPLSERTSTSTLPVIGSNVSASSSDNVSRFSTVASRTNTSITSHAESPGSPTLLAGLLPAASGTGSVRRSDSWWSRLARRTSSVSSRNTPYSAIRDPNPPPRLVTIDESVHSHSPESKKSSPGVPTPSGSQGSQNEQRAQAIVGRHGKSMSSLRTTDSEAIERMAGTMDVVVKSRKGRVSSDSTADVSLNGSDLSGDGHGRERTRSGDSDLAAMYASPTSMEPHESIFQSLPIPPRTHSPHDAPPVSLYNSANQAAASSSPSPTLHKPTPVAPSGAVAARIQAYERQISHDQAKPKQGDRSSKRMSVDYGLVPRRSLYVANPDHRLSQSSTESS